jgi:hypothetical protein
MGRRIETVILPAILAPALINGDESGLDEKDKGWLVVIRENLKGGRVVDVGTPYFSWGNDFFGFFLYTGDVAPYTVIYEEKPFKERT